MGGKTNIPCDATSYSFRNGREKKINTPDLNVKSAVIKIKKITNTVINKQCRLDFLRIWVNRRYWTRYVIMLYLPGFCYFAVSFAILWRPEFIKRSWCLSNICIICIFFIYFILIWFLHSFLKIIFYNLIYTK